jgi:hypothetical protein
VLSTGGEGIERVWYEKLTGLRFLNEEGGSRSQGVLCLGLSMGVLWLMCRRICLKRFEGCIFGGVLFGLPRSRLSPRE